jgi:putative spermidine/putrescine transport system permease protein
VASTGLSRTVAPRAGRADAARPALRVLTRAGRLAADWLPAAPLIALAVAMLVLPTAMVVVQSMRAEDGQLTLQFWAETLQRRGDRRAIATSLGLGVVCASISLLVGAPLAWRISRAAIVARAPWLSLLNVAANFGGIGLAFGFTAALGTYGMVTLLLQGAGIGFAPPSAASFLGLTIAYVYTNVPLFVLLTLPAMRIVRQSWLEAADVIGATRGQFWRAVGLPVLAPFLAAGWLLIFTWSIGIYGLAYALAGNAATSQLRLMTLQIGVALNSAAGSQERAAVMAAILLFLAAMALAVYRYTVRRALRWFV